MRNTIKAKYGYRVRKVVNIDTGDEGFGVYDGSNLLFVGTKRPYSEYKDDERNNEMFRFCEIFTTVKGNQFIYWRDEEIDEDYITKVN